MRLNKLRATVPAFDIIGIGAIEHNHHRLRRFRNQLSDICIRNFCSRRIARIGNEDHPSARGDGGQNRLHVHMSLCLWHTDKARPRCHSIKAVHQEPMFSVNDLHLRTGIGLT